MNICPNHVPEYLKVNNSVLPELRLRVNQCLVDVPLDDCVEPGTSCLVAGNQCSLAAGKQVGNGTKRSCWISRADTRVRSLWILTGLCHEAGVPLAGVARAVEVDWPDVPVRGVGWVRARVDLLRGYSCASAGSSTWASASVSGSSCLLIFGNAIRKRSASARISVSISPGRFSRVSYLYFYHWEKRCI